MPSHNQNYAHDLDHGRTEPDLHHARIEHPTVASPSESNEDSIRYQELTTEDPNDPPRIALPQVMSLLREQSLQREFLRSLSLGPVP